MLNRTVLVGRMTKDPEMRVSPSGVTVTTFTLAVNRAFKKDEVDFISVVCFKKAAENVNNFCSKGSLVGVDGRIQTRNYENKEGRKVYVTEVVADSVQFLETKGKNENAQQQAPQQNNAATPPQNANNGNPFANATGPIDISDDDLPF
ncbi:single-stranded DNA-binding protein [Macrococcoides caseolyticum]|uniref:single-stranded DNA-binding protein n=1 Tax=Macrococcoides caseolyticum TaxID=69966 RepID=UPI000C33928C|nr:single-stranded DNA-binding protein [Macrococcus caseolyticus]PKF14034.1 single-stranded DNA-binding protein [Macrococcus caseolyticus]